MTALERFFDRRQIFWVCLPLIVVAYALRDVNALIWPAAFFEDGRYLIEPYYNQTDIFSTWQFYENYVVWTSNLLAYIGSYLPITQVPRFLTVSELLLISLPVSLILRPEIKIPLVNVRDRLLMAAILVVAPITNFYLVNTLMYGLWPLLAALSLIVLFVRVTGWPAFCAYALLSLLCIFSNPVALALVPFVLFRAYRERGTKTGSLMLVLLLLFVIYFLTGVEQGSRIRGSLSLELLFLTARTLLERVFFEGLLGGQLRTDLERSDFAWVVPLVGGAIFVSFLFLHRALWRKDRPVAQSLLPVWGIAFGILVICIYVRGDTLEVPWRHRYTYVPCLLFIVLGFVLTKSILQGLPKRRFFWPAFLVMLVLWASAMVYKQRPFYHWSVIPGMLLADFLEAVAKKEEAGEPFCMLLSRGARDRWRIKLNSRGWEGDCEVVKADGS